MESFYKNVHQELRRNGYQGEIFCIDFKKATEHKDPSALNIALWKEGKTDQFQEIIHQAMEQAIPANDMPNEPTTFTIADEKVLKALVERKLQALYVLAPEIADIDAMEKSRIKLAARDIWKMDFPSREFEGLLRVAKVENELKRRPEPQGQYHSNTKNDFVDGLERERRTVARRLHEQDNGIGERLVRLGNESMLRPSSRELGAAALDDTRIAA